ncbi:MAG: hypothetical protein K0Q50_2070 [Vampirovibrio sp.]|nr:hypothetical protein [Vampirovibrio sp.]
MILEAFSTYLKQQQPMGHSPERILFDWLHRILLLPPAPDDMVGRVIHAEIALINCNGHRGFEGKSETGRQLLRSMVQYCRSYDHWQFSRWVHELRASDFSRNLGS